MCKIPKNLFDKFYIHEKWFKHNPFGIHGILHQYRVLALSYLIGKMEKVDVNILCYSAIFHDVRKNNDGIDIFHGKRAEKWVLKNYPNLKDIPKIYDIIFWHNISDNQILNLQKKLNVLKMQML